MNTFNSINFIKALKEGYDAIPVLQGDCAAKKLVADSTKSNGFYPEDVFSFILSKLGISSSLTEEDWKKLIETSIKKGGFFGQSLKEFKTSLKGKLSYEEMFKLAASCCGLNPARYSQELCLNNVNWEKVVETLVKTSEESIEEKKVEIPVENPAPATIKKAKKTEEKKTAVKAIKSDPRSKSITLVNEKTGEVKTWSSYRACEKEIYGDDKKGHGTVSQLLNPKKGLKRLPGGWVLPKKEEKTREIEKAHKRAVIQMKKDKRGRLRTVNTFNSITEASKATGISHSGISKVISGTYQSTGGYVWKSAETAA